MIIRVSTEEVKLEEIIEPEKELSEFEKEQQAKGWDPKGEKSAEEFRKKHLK